MEELTLQEKKSFIVEFITGIQARQPLTMSDVEAKIAVRTPITSRGMEAADKNGADYTFYFTNLLDKPTWENHIVPAFGEFLQDEETLEAFESLDALRDHMNQEFVNKCSVSVNVFEDDSHIEKSDIGRGIEVSGVPRTYEYDMDGNGTMVTRIGLSLSTVHKTERAKAGGASLTKDLLAMLSI